jgi:hypothetical protein
MFGDCARKVDFSQSIRWKLWTEALMDLCDKRNVSLRTNDNEVEEDDNSTTTAEQHPLKICILEIGCGMTVPTCRHNAETLFSKIQHHGGSPTLIRVNPEFPLCPGLDVADALIPIMSRGLRAIRQIDDCYQRRRRRGDGQNSVPGSELEK